MNKVFILSFFLFTVLNISIYSQNTINIPVDYPTIQEGINAATDGDIVLVADGTYLENIDFNGKGITVASQFLLDGNESHIENTVIDGSQPANPNLASVVSFWSREDSTSILCGFTITGGTGAGWATYERTGGGIYIYDSSPVIINNIIEYNHIIAAGHAGGSAILVSPRSNSTTIIENNIIKNNIAQSTGSNTWINGTILVSAAGSSKLIIRNNIISDNTLLPEPDNLYCNGGAISAYGYDEPSFLCIIENNIITRNEVMAQGQNPIGGGMLLSSINAIVRNNIIAYNSASRYGGVYYANAFANVVHPVLENNTIFGNTATVGGGLSTHHFYEIINCIIWGNSSPQYYGATATIDYSTLEESYPNGNHNLSLDPEFLDTTYFLLSDTSPCIDEGNPDPMYNDVEDPNNSGYALYPAQGTLINDISHFGGPNSTWASILSDTLYVPADYSTIQGAIDAAIAGNTILVADGTYYENINYRGKAITVASHFFIDGDSTHIENTIIDGSQPSHPDSGSAVFFVNGEDASSVLCGFTITGGTGTVSLIWNDRSGGGVYVELSGATICNNIIEFNSITHDDYTNAGGISIVDSDSIIVENNVIRNNTITGNNWSAGGGIAIYDFTQMGYAKVANNKILNNTATDPNDASGGGIEINGGSNSFFIICNYIKGNECSGYAGGIDFYDCIPIVKNNLIIENTAPDGGGVVFDAIGSASAEFKDSNGKERSSRYNRQHSNKSIQSKIQFAAAFENNTIVNNTATVSGGGITVWTSVLQLMNFIVWGNTAPTDPQVSGSMDIQYSDVEGGHTGTGNIDADPLFVSTNEYFLLDATSPCIDAGNPDPNYFDVGAGGNALPPAQGSLVNDMGHLGGPSSLWYLWDWPMPVEDESTILSEYILMQNYPNPFNPTTTIEYAIPERSYVELKVYDVLGREVVSSINEEQDAGYYEIDFNAAKLSSGVYLYQLKAGQFIETRKMLLLK